MIYQFNLIPKDVPKIKTKFRNIQTKLPVPESLDIINKSLKYEPASMNHQVPCVWEKAIDYKIYDLYGNIWIDFSSSIFINNTGHGNSNIIEAIYKMVKKPLLTSYTFNTEIRSLLVEKIVKMVKSDGIEKAFLLSTGSETNEVALRLARLNGIKNNPNKNIVIAFEDSFHGRTLGSQMLSGKENMKKWIGYKDPNIYHLPYPTDPFIQMEDQDSESYGKELFYKNIKELNEKGINIENICAFIFEPYLGFGALFHLTGYIKAMKEFANNINALIIVDEVQSGFYRTGKLFGYQHYDIKPDIICCGKAISSSLPLSAVLTRTEIMELDDGLSSTHSGSPICCSAALANLEYLESNISEETIKEKESIIKNILFYLKAKYPNIIKSFHGKGLLFAIFIVKPNTKILDIDFVDKIVEKAFQKGLILIRTGCGTIKIGAPLTIPKEALIEGFKIIDESIEELISKEVTNTIFDFLLTKSGKGNPIKTSF